MRRSPKPLPDIDALPAGAFLTRAQVAALTGFSVQAFKEWAMTPDRGPRLTRIEGNPRYRVADVRAWIKGDTNV